MHRQLQSPASLLRQLVGAAALIAPARHVLCWQWAADGTLERAASLAERHGLKCHPWLPIYHPLGSAPARLLCLLSARLAALGQLGTPRARPSHRAPRHRLGGSSELPPNSPILLPLTVKAEGGNSVQGRGAELRACALRCARRQACNRM